MGNVSGRIENRYQEFGFAVVISYYRSWIRRIWQLRMEARCTHLLCMIHALCPIYLMKGKIWGRHTRSISPFWCCRCFKHSKVLHSLKRWTGKHALRWNKSISDSQHQIRGSFGITFLFQNARWQRMDVVGETWKTENLSWERCDKFFVLFLLVIRFSSAGLPSDCHCFLGLFSSSGFEVHIST